MILNWWRNQWKKTQIQGVVINAGGIVAYYPTKIPYHYQAQYLQGRDLFGDLCRAAHEDGQTTPGGNVSLERSGQCDEIRHAEGLIRLQNIHRMVWDTVGLFGRDLRRTDIYPL